MKTFNKIALLLFISISFSAKKITFLQQNTLTATYKGVTDDYMYKFVDDKNVEHLFYDYNEPEYDEEESENVVSIDLSNDKNIGKKFELTWSTKQIDELDENGEETGKKITVKTILTIKKL